MAPTTECLSKTRRVTMMSGKPVEGINRYRSWPKYRPGYDMPFEGCEQWNERRRIVPEDEPFFDRTDYDQIDKEITDKIQGFVDTLYKK